jgi:hypothetical protein
VYHNDSQSPEDVGHSGMFISLQAHAKKMVMILIILRIPAHFDPCKGLQGFPPLGDVVQE